ncbi:Threonyl-tRNA synthetase, partial [hydrothermal vent metagenome]
VRIEADLSSERVQKKIRNAQLRKIPYMLVVGAREMESEKVAVRLRNGRDLGAIEVEEFLTVMKNIETSRVSNLWTED